MLLPYWTFDFDRRLKGEEKVRLFAFSFLHLKFLKRRAIPLFGENESEQNLLPHENLNMVVKHHKKE